MAKLTPEACRAGRAILKWSIRELANEAGIAFSTVHLFEKNGTARDATQQAIEKAFKQNNVEIINGQGTGAKLIY